MSKQPQNFRYDWEDDAITSIDADAGKYAVIGVAVANLETMEACFIDMSDIEAGIARADLLKDVKGDVFHAYQNSLKLMREYYDAQRENGNAK